MSQIPTPDCNDYENGYDNKAPFITGVKLAQQEPAPAYNSQVTVDLKNYLTNNLQAQIDAHGLLDVTNSHYLLK